MPNSEAETRKQIIDIGLAKAGWNVNDSEMVTEELDIKTSGVEDPDLQTDYSGNIK